MALLLPSFSMLRELTPSPSTSLTARVHAQGHRNRTGTKANVFVKPLAIISKLLLTDLLLQRAPFPQLGPPALQGLTILLFLFGRSWPGVPTLQDSMTGLR